MTNHQKLDALVRVTEQYFRLPEGMIRAQDRSQPLVSFRRLAWQIARDAGMSYYVIGKMCDKRGDTVRRGVMNVRNKNCQPYWAHARAALKAAWEAEIARAG